MVIESVARQRVVGFTKRRVEFQRFLRVVFLRLCPFLFGWQESESEREAVKIGKARISQCVVRIQFNCLLIILATLVEILATLVELGPHPPFVPVKTASQI